MSAYMGIEGLSEARSATNLGFIKTALAPRHYDVAPSSEIDGAPSFNKKVDYAATHKIIEIAKFDPTKVTTGPDLISQTEGVRSDTGLVVWLTEMGVDGIYHMGIVDGNKTNPNTIYAPSSTYDKTVSVRGLGANSFGGYGGRTVLEPGTDLNNNIDISVPPSTFEWQAPCALPRTGDNEVIRVSPNLSENFSRCRLYAGICQIEGNAVPIGGTAITGELSAGAVASTRDISQSTNGTVVTAYGVSALSQESVTKQDGVKLVQVDKGITTIVGPDFAETFSAPSQISSDSINGEWATYTASKTAGKASVNYVKEKRLEGVVLSEIWVSPLQTNFFTGAGVGPGNLSDPFGFTDGSGIITNPLPHHNQVLVPAIDETGVLDIDLDLSAEWGWSTGADNTKIGTTGALYVNAIHIFCTCNADGTVNYNQFGQSQFIPFNENEGLRQALCGSATLDFTGPRPYTRCSFRPRNYRSSYTQTGKYVGTYFQVSAQFIRGSGADNTLWFAEMQPARVHVRARNVDLPGRVGMAHIMRYDNVSVGQSLTIRGQALVQCIAQGSIAPYVQNAIAHSPSAIDSQTEILLSLLFRSGLGGRFARNYVTKHYNEMVLPMVASLSPGRLKQLLTDEEGGGDAPAAMGAQAAGIFGSLGGAIGGLADNIFGAQGDFSPGVHDGTRRGRMHMFDQGTY